MAKRKYVTCIRWRCDEPPHLGGLCKMHYDEAQVKEEERRTAVEALMTRCVDGRPPEKPGLKDELTRASEWWDRACIALQVNSQDEVLLDETECALSWCTSIAISIIHEELAHRRGERAGDYAILHLKELSWERFKNLEAGLMSNGIKRPKP